MVAKPFEVLRQDGKLFINKEDLIAYLADELTYTISNAKDTDLSEEFVSGMAFSLAALVTNVGKIGR